MKVLMLGWELFPHYAGGVGVVCHELTKALAKKEIEITYLMPSAPAEMQVQHLKRLLIADKLLAQEKISIKKVESLLNPYITKEEYSQVYERTLKMFGREVAQLYGTNLMEEVYKFADRVTKLIKAEEFDVIHAHDWTTFPAAIVLKKATGKPLIVHVHITEFDKTGGMGADPQIYNIEREGMLNADAVIAVSNVVKQRCINNYYIPPEKIFVVHNAAIPMNPDEYYGYEKLKKDEKIVLFAGRVTLQKGPDYFMEAAKIVLSKNPNVTFIIAGSGDMLFRLIERAAELDIAHKFTFTGFYNRKEAEKLFSMADVFVMPSVSDPFGVVSLEAMAMKVPTIVSAEAGVSEVIKHCIKFNFWDVHDLANKILALIEYPALREEITHMGYAEVQRLTWEKPASLCIEIYNKLMAS